MAIFNVSVSNISRASKKTNMFKALAYITAEPVTNPFTEATYDYRRRERVQHTEVVLAETMPEEWSDAKTLFTEIENYETADNARLAKRIMICVSHENSKENNIKAVSKYINQTFTQNGYACVWAYHEATEKQVEKRARKIENARFKVLTEGRDLTPQQILKIREEVKLTDAERDKLRNPHVHLLVLDRQFKKGKWQAKEHSKTVYKQQVGENGEPMFDAKNEPIYELDAKGRKIPEVYIDKETGKPKRDKHGKLVHKKKVTKDNIIDKKEFLKENIRGGWAKILNEELENNGFDCRVTEKSNLDAAIDKLVAQGADPEQAAEQAAQQQELTQEKEYYSDERLEENALRWAINRTQRKVKALLDNCIAKIEAKFEKFTAIFKKKEDVAQQPAEIAQTVDTTASATLEETSKNNTLTEQQRPSAPQQVEDVTEHSAKQPQEEEPLPEEQLPEEVVSGVVPDVSAPQEEAQTSEQTTEQPEAVTPPEAPEQPEIVTQFATTQGAAAVTRETEETAQQSVDVTASAPIIDATQEAEAAPPISSAALDEEQPEDLTEREEPALQPEAAQQQEEAEKEEKSYTELHVHDILNKITGYLKRTIEILKKAVTAGQQPEDTIKQEETDESIITDIYEYHEDPAKAAHAAADYEAEAQEHNANLGTRAETQPAENAQISDEKGEGGYSYPLDQEEPQDSDYAPPEMKNNTYIFSDGEDWHPVYAGESFSDTIFTFDEMDDGTPCVTFTDRHGQDRYIDGKLYDRIFGNRPYAQVGAQAEIRSLIIRETAAKCEYSTVYKHDDLSQGQDR